MINFLTSPLPEAVSVNGKDYPINTDFRVWIDIQNVLSDSSLSSVERVIRFFSLAFISPALPDSVDGALFALSEFLSPLPKGEGINEKCTAPAFSFTYDGKTYTAKAGSEIGNYFHYNNKTAIVQGSRNKNYSRGIDISDTVAVAFTKSLIEEYGTLFKNLGCTKFDIGGDELLGWGDAVTSNVSKWKQLDHWKEYAIDRTGNSKAVAYDAFLLYMNDLYDLVTGLGYTSVRM
jgi:hypothetical protein